MSTSLSDALSAVNPCWAVVQANHCTTRYLKLGRGTTVVLLLRLSGSAGHWPAIAEYLGRSYRVLVPDFDAPARELGDWLDGFLEGVGGGPCVLVAAHDLCLPALQQAMQQPDRVTRLVLATEAGNNRDTADCHFALAASYAKIPLLMLDDQGQISEIISSLDAFLSPER